MNTTSANLSDLLQPAVEVPPRMKLFLFGDTGVGKTYSSLQIATVIGGKIALLDPEAGARRYAGPFTFDIVPTDDLRVLKRTIRGLAQGGHDYRTLIIDPITLLWRSWQEQWEDRFMAAASRKSKGKHGEWYELQLKDWGPIKRTWEAFLRMVVNLDMNVIVTAREKAVFESSGGDLRKVGETFDGEKGLPYWFDTVVRMAMTGSGKRIAFTVKDRTSGLPTPGPAWDFDSGQIAAAFGEDGTLARPVEQTLADAETLDEIRQTGIELDYSEADLNSAARTKFGRATIDELSPEQAAQALAGLKDKLDQTNTTSETKEQA